MSYSAQEILKIIGIVLLCVAIIAIVVTLVGNIIGNRDNGDYDKVNVKWSVGGLDEDGTFLKKETDSLVSDHIKLKEGLKVIVDFDKSVKYNIMFYDENHIFLGAMEGGATYSNKVLSRTDIVNTYADAEYFRITLIDVEEKNGYINFFEKSKLGKYVTVYTTGKVAETETTDDN